MVACDTPLVSILIPCYNAERWVAQAVESAIGQSYAKKEIIVIDDGSTDGSIDVLQQFRRKIMMRVRENRGGNPTRNELLAMCSGEWVQFLDADDYLAPNKVARQVGHVLRLMVKEALPVDVVYSPVRTECMMDRNIRFQEPAEPCSDDPWVLHARWELTQTGGALFRRAALSDVGDWNEHQKCCQDNELFLRLLMAGKAFSYCRGAVAIYRRFEGGTVSTRARSSVAIEILRILEHTERFLEGSSQLTSERRKAINEHRFWLARKVWPHDRLWANEIMTLARCSFPGFSPNSGRHASPLYRAIFKVFGFSAAEQAAALKRRLS